MAQPGGGCFRCFRMVNTVKRSGFAVFFMSDPSARPGEFLLRWAINFFFAPVYNNSVMKRCYETRQQNGKAD